MNRLGEIIKEKGLKKGFVASEVRVSIPTLQRYIEGINYPNVKIAYKLSKLLNYSIEDIFFANNTIIVVNNNSSSYVK